MSKDQPSPRSALEKRRLARAAILDHLPKDTILDRYDGAGGMEVSSGKFVNPQSSAALAANAFGIFLDAPHLLLLSSLRLTPEPVVSVTLEAEFKFPWRGGLHPVLDIAVETRDYLIGIESKRYEPFRDAKSVSFSPAYFQPVWGRSMESFERARDELASGKLAFSHLDAGQLVKHAFGLRTQANKRGKKAVLLYLYSEPKAYPDGQPISPGLIAQHRQEVETFCDKAGAPAAEVSFASIRYSELLDAWAGHDHENMRAHATALLARFDV